jgi:elongation factor Tu
MSTAANEVVYVKADVRLLSSDEGGRLTPIANGYRPPLSVGGIDGYGSVILGEGATMAPGKSRVVDIVMVGSPTFVRALHEGQEFSLREGPKDIGEGRITHILTVNRPGKSGDSGV